MNLIYKKNKFINKIFFFSIILFSIISIIFQNNIFANPQKEINKHKYSKEEYEEFKEKVLNISDENRNKMIQDFLINWIESEDNLKEIKLIFKRRVNMVFKTVDKERDELTKKFFEINNE
ncbi:MAG: hypothetical protein AB3N34_03015 [Lettuce witches'-broom phytoplasma]